MEHRHCAFGQNGIRKALTRYHLQRRAVPDQQKIAALDGRCEILFRRLDHRLQMRPSIFVGDEIHRDLDIFRPEGKLACVACAKHRAGENAGEGNAGRAEGIPQRLRLFDAFA